MTKLHPDLWVFQKCTFFGGNNQSLIWDQFWSYWFCWIWGTLGFAAFQWIPTPTNHHHGCWNSMIKRNLLKSLSIKYGLKWRTDSVVWCTVTVQVHYSIGWTAGRDWDATQLERDVKPAPPVHSTIITGSATNVFTDVIPMCVVFLMVLNYAKCKRNGEWLSKTDNPGEVLRLRKCTSKFNQWNTIMEFCSLKFSLLSLID